MTEPENTSIHVVGAALLDGHRCLVAQRGPDMRHPGKWEFPGGKVRPNEKPEAALVRELREELGLETEVRDWLGRGESSVDGRRVVLDVHAARITGGFLHLHEHARVRWIDGADLDGLDWTDADVPVLPAVRERLRDRPRADRFPAEVHVVGADWSKERSRRVVYSATLTDSWHVARETSPPDGWSLDRLLLLARRLQEKDRRPVLIGIDAALGIPEAFARRAGARGFLDYLTHVFHSGGPTESCSAADEWSCGRPFFRVPRRKGGLSKFEDSAGGRSTLLRQVDLRTGAKPVFAVSGIPGAVGSASRSLWAEIVSDLSRLPRGFRLWPFEGDLELLLMHRSVVVAETYPRAAYSTALADDLPAPLRPVAKTRRKARADALDELAGAEWLRRARVEIDDTDPARFSEDHFDALMTAVALVRLVAERRPATEALVDPVNEGGILAASESVRTRTTAVRRRPASGYLCPIEGCGKVFKQGRLGWDAHVAAPGRHPDWHPEEPDPERRKDLFRKEFGKWLGDTPGEGTD